jgi:hypothetical protein
MLVMIHVLFVTSLGEATADTLPALVVRTYLVPQVPSSTWTMAIDTTAILLARAGIRVEWLHCSSLRAGDPDSGPARCTLPYERNEVAVRIVSRPSIAPRDQILLGDSLIDASRHSGTLATVYLEHIDWLAHAAGVSTETVMGRAMAHEIGHLLLGTNTHSAHGLMRAVWNAEELARNRPGDWTIGKADAALMRTAVIGRTVARVAGTAPSLEPGTAAQGHL